VSPARKLDPFDGPVAAFAWTLVQLREERGLSLSQLAPKAHFDKGTLSRVTNGQTLPVPAHLRGYVQACTVNSAPWESLPGKPSTTPTPRPSRSSPKC
jgi:transcriptional regulator with XRE-family HTH domain